MATAMQSSSTVNPSTDINNGLLSATVVAGLKKLGSTLTTAISKTLIANSLKLTLHPDASMIITHNTFLCWSIYSLEF